MPYIRLAILSVTSAVLFAGCCSRSGSELPDSGQQAPSTLFEEFTAPPSFDPATLWSDLEDLIAKDHYWRAVALLHQADVEEQFAYDARKDNALPIGITGVGLSFPVLWAHHVIYEFPHRVLPGTRDYSVNAGHSAWNTAAEFWATDYNLILISRMDLYQALDEGDITEDEFRRLMHQRSTTRPEPGP